MGEAGYLAGWARPNYYIYRGASFDTWGNYYYFYAICQEGPPAPDPALTIAELPK